MLEATAATERDLDKPKEWANKNLKKFHSDNLAPGAE